MSDKLPERHGRIVKNSVDEAFTFYDEAVRVAEAQAKAEPDNFSADLILQIVWTKLTERMIANGWSIGDLTQNRTPYRWGQNERYARTGGCDNKIVRQRSAECS